MRGLVQDIGVLGCLGGNLTHHFDERVYGLLALRFRGLYHEGLVEQEREIDGGSMEAIVQQTFGHIQGGGAGDVVVCAVVHQAVKHEFVLANTLNGQFVHVLEAFLDVIGA